MHKYTHTRPVDFHYLWILYVQTCLLAKLPLEAQHPYSLRHFHGHSQPGLLAAEDGPGGIWPFPLSSHIIHVFFSQSVQGPILVLCPGDRAGFNAPTQTAEVLPRGLSTGRPRCASWRKYVWEMNFVQAGATCCWPQAQSECINDRH